MKKTKLVYSVLGLVVLVILYGFLFGNLSLRTPDQKGLYLFQEKKYEQAADEFADPMWKGAALFRDGKFNEAAAVFSGYDTAEAAYNHGNSLVMLGKYEEAVERYDRALQLEPDLAAAKKNREIALGRAGKLKKEGGDTTGGMLDADEIVFNQAKSSRKEEQEESAQGQQLGDAELRAMWLRNVQTKPADFLRAKFSYQAAMQNSDGENREKPQAKGKGEK